MDKRNEFSEEGFTLLELLVVMVLVSIIAGISTTFVTSGLSSGRFDATVRDVVSTIRHSKYLAQSSGKIQVLNINLDNRTYGIRGGRQREIPRDLNIKVIDPARGEVLQGEHDFSFYPVGAIQGGGIILGNDRKTAHIALDPVAGAKVLR